MSPSSPWRRVSMWLCILTEIRNGSLADIFRGAWENGLPAWRSPGILQLAEVQLVSISVEEIKCISTRLKHRSRKYSPLSL